MVNFYAIAKEGKKVLLFFVGFCIIWWLFFGFSLFFLLLFVLLYVYRDKIRPSLAYESNALYSICDAKITNIKDIDDEDIGKNAKILILSNRLHDCGVLRAFFTSKVLNFNKLLDYSVKDGEICEEISFIVNINGNKIKIIIRKKPYLKNIYFDTFDELNFNDKIAFLLSGEVALIVNSSCDITSCIGDEVKLGDRLGYFTDKGV